VTNRSIKKIPSETETPVETHPESHHRQHEAVLKRLARIEGHVRGIMRMVEAEEPCPDILVQVAAVRSALNAAGRIILEDHMQGCLVDAVRKDDYKEALRDLKMSLDKFVR